jgi:hypothetical protein
LVLGAATGASAQEKRAHDWSVPLVYQAENTGAHYSAPAFPSFERLPIIRPLPDPFRFAAGYRDTSFASWERRRNEIKAAIEKYEIGAKPDCSDCTITALYTPAAAGAVAGTLAVTVTRNGKSLTLNERVYIPQGMGDGPFPVLIPMTLAFPPFFVPPVPNYGSLPAEVFSSRPIATIDFFHNDVTVYSFFGLNDHATDPFYQLYPELCAGTCNGNVSNSGQYAAWAWGVSRLIDGIEIAAHQAVNPLPVDIKHIAVTGCSYAGKMALFAGAFDERIGLTIAQENGGGGAPAWRVTDDVEAGNASEDIQRTDYNWFAGQMKQFAGVNRYKMPTDHHELMAMVAPRALLETGNTDFYWLSNRSNYVSARATQRVYRTLGIGDRFGFYIDGGHNHCATLPEEAPVVAAFVDKFMLGDATANTDVEVNPYPTLDYQRWTAWWGGDPYHDPKFPTDWNPGDGTVMMGFDRNDRDGHFLGWPFGDLWGFGDNRHLWINSGDTVQSAYQVAVRGGAHPDATVTLVNGNVQADVRCFDGTSYTLTIPFPANDATQVPANRNNFFPSPSTNQGSATASQCSGVLEGVYFQALGVNPGAVGNPGGPGFTTTDMDNPLETRFSCSANSQSTGFSRPLTVKFQP